MALANNRIYLKQLFETKKKHDTGQAIDVLPFLTKRTGAVKNQFNNILGEFTRSLSNLTLDEKAIKRQDEFYTSEEENEISEQIANNVEFKEEDEKYDFIRFLDQYLFKGEKINPIHPFLFNYIKIDKNHKNEFGKYAHFMKDVLVEENSKVSTIFKNKEADDILTELILSKMDGLKENKDTNGVLQYEQLLRPISSLYQEDLLYLSKHKEYFLSTFALLTHFYVFMYASQLVLKFEQFSEANYDSIQPLYFALDWESISKRRKAADDLEGFRYVKGKSSNLFPHIHTLSHLSHLVSEKEITGEKGEVISLKTYSEITKYISQKGEEYEELFLSELNMWIQEYADMWKIKNTTKATSVEEGLRELFTCLKQGTSAGVADKYGKNIEDLGFNQFIKNRGSLGHILNVKHDFVLLLTAVSVKDERIPLNELFVEFEKRGVALDRYSKKEVISMLDSQNLIDKKSDSGDAQYVKPIL
ncbi:DNA phosphorothioation-dependent restriction protein DptG [Bacillus sp. RO2]|uniref:DNA phosphorothioation-dependent restriction protein DptG n=1 Tax=Bacillus sp. RO2 TaxID=2723913 RepID=UPI00145DC2DB|nr:DNA phosphorothioation-dependent restriction protein DptG [Bacillus sp. RO2]NMH73562.1 DNA phosphorothioation-dependent restriction protein DptG [Bacillus sp. RO2]